MTKPDAVSKAAWEAACLRQPDGLLPSNLLHGSRCDLAYWLDDFTRPLRALAKTGLAYVEAEFDRTDDGGYYHTMTEGTDTLDRYTPEVTR